MMQHMLIVNDSKNLAKRTVSDKVSKDRAYEYKLSIYIRDKVKVVLDLSTYATKMN